MACTVLRLWRMQYGKGAGSFAFGYPGNCNQRSLFAARVAGDIDSGQPEHHLLNGLVDHFGQLVALPDQFSAYLYIALFVPVGQKPVMADTHKPLGQHVEQKTTDKFHGIDGLLLHLARVSVLIGETDLAVITGHDTVVGDSHPVGIAAKIVQHVLGLVNGLADIDHPSVGVAAVEQILKAPCAAQRLGLSGKNQLVVPVGRFKIVQVFFSEHNG